MADYAVSHSTATVEAAISAFEQVLQLRHIGHEQRAEAASDLGNALFSFCFYNKEDHSRRARCFDLLREALLLCPPGHSRRDRALHNLARALDFVGYDEKSGGQDNLRESISLNRAALDLRPAGHAERSFSLNNLGCGLHRSFKHSGDIDELAEAITIHHELLQLRPPGHLHRDLSLSNLSIALACSFQHHGGSETIAEAISINREALQLRPVGHPLRWMTLTGLGNTLGLSFASTGFQESLLEAIGLQREAVQLMPSTHPGYADVLGNLAEFLTANFRQSHDRSVLAEAITLHRRSFLLSAEGYNYPERLNELAEALVASFDQYKDLDHLNEAVSLHRETLKSRPPGHYKRTVSLHRLARLLCRTELHCWSEAMSLYHEALGICPAESPLRAEVLSDLSRCFLDPGSPFFDLSQGVAHLSRAYADNFAHVNRRLRWAISDLPRVERAYAEAVVNLDPSTMESSNSRVLELYAQVIGLLPRAANFGLDHSTRLQAVTGLDEIARDAAARAILLGRESQALEMLEEGRGVFWAQTLHLRTSAFDDVPEKDHQELQRLLGLLEYSARRVENSDQVAGQRERDLERRRQLNEEAEALILKIRGYPGLDRFLLAPAFDALIGALPAGFVVLVNASKLGYHALLLHKDTSHATSLELQPPRTGFDSAALRSHLPRDASSNTREGETRAMRKDIGRGGSFLNTLAVLWTSIVQPVLKQLGLQVRCECRVREEN
jgi:tetratricopeptide (TPR) repeat protein